jgi:RNA polymerase sigma-70 factor (ECF subfamily)
VPAVDEPIAPTEVTDEALLELARAGDKPAFDRLADRWRGRLTGFCILMVGDADEAESLSQEALTRAFSSLAAFKAGARFSPWVHGIALNLCRQLLRNRARRAMPMENESLTGVADRRGRSHGVLSSLYRRELSERLMQALDHLPIALHEAFVMRYIEGRSYEEISEIAGVAAGTLRARAFRARLLLQSQLGNLLDTACLPADEVEDRPE